MVEDMYNLTATNTWLGDQPSVWCAVAMGTLALCLRIAYHVRQSKVPSPAA